MPLIGLIGYPLGHSFSPSYFKDKFHRLGIHDWEYHLYPISSLTHLPELISSTPDLVAFNVTIPYKTAILPFCHSLSDAVEVIGAANLILIERQEDQIFLHAHNTDVIGFKNSLSNFISGIISNALILGTGGAAKAAAYVLNELQIHHQTIGRKTETTYKTIDCSKFDLIINCTPVGMYKEQTDYSSDILPLNYESIQSGAFFFDMVYNPEETAMMQAFKQQGANVKNGLEMLHGQADAAWDIVQESLLDNMDNTM